MPCASHSDYRELTGRDLKEEVSRDVFSTQEEAEERAEEIGCSGTHSHETSNGTVYMPCASHGDYERLTGDTLETPKQDPRMGEGPDIFDNVLKIGDDGKATVIEGQGAPIDGAKTFQGKDGFQYLLQQQKIFLLVI